MKDPNNSGSQQQTSGSAADPVSSVFPSAPEVHQLGAQPSSTNIKPITERISKTKF